MHLENLKVKPWVAIEKFSEVMRSADIFVVLLEKNAGQFSVPSKILTYCMIGHPILGALPTDNLGARIINDYSIGFASSPDEFTKFLDNAQIFMDDYLLRENAGWMARKYADENFEISEISKKFTKIISEV